MSSLKLTALIVLSFLSFSVLAQTNASAIKRWNDYWICVPGEPLHDYDVYFFRKKLTLTTTPSHFTVHVSADNRYKLFIIGQLASLGPGKKTSVRE